VLLIIGLLAYKKERSWRLILTSVVFALFFAEGLILTLSILIDDLDYFSSDLTFILSVNVLVLLFLFFSVFTPPRTKKKSKTHSKKGDDMRS
jgi:hypothetical protein